MQSRRRHFLAAVAATIPAAVSLTAHAAQAEDLKITANEDLMQEHGLVQRVNLIYARGLELWHTNKQFDASVLTQAAQIMNRIIHAHHEMEEEQIIFPIVEKVSADLKNVVQVLRGQHQAARTITATIGNNATPGRANDPKLRQELTTAMQGFMNMYAPHGAIEDTLIYPAFRNSLSAGEYRKVSARFAENERRMNGDDGFGHAAATLGRIEQALGMDLARYTRQMEPATDSASAGPHKK